MKYVCQVCGYVYDDDKEAVPFSQLPDTWECPLCHAPKALFEELKEAPVSAASPIARTENTAASSAAGEKSQAEKESRTDCEVRGEGDLTRLTTGQLKALCLNLARGCERQYKNEEADLFRQLADYFKAEVPPVNDPKVENVAAALKEDVDGYPQVRATADASSDRGAARVCVWGEKVTRMLSSLAQRYLVEGEKMLAGTSVWVCTACGFVFIGDKAPENCPVCKVPAWKFEKVEGRARS